MTRPTDVPSQLSQLTATIANGASLSDAIDLGGTSLTGLLLPATWTTADITVQASVDGNAFVNVYNDLGGETLIKAAASRLVTLDPAQFMGFSHVKLRSGTSGTPVNQASEREITLLARTL